MHQSNTGNDPQAAARIKPVPGKPILAAATSDIDTGHTEKAMLLGIDLGTSRSSIVSMNGTRKTVESYVGYAKDPVSRKMLKADVIYGRHALDNRLAVDLVRRRAAEEPPRRQRPASLHGGHGSPRPR